MEEEQLLSGVSQSYGCFLHFPAQLVSVTAGTATAAVQPLVADKCEFNEAIEM